MRAGTQALIAENKPVLRTRDGGDDADDGDDNGGGDDDDDAKNNGDDGADDDADDRATAKGLEITSHEASRVLLAARLAFMLAILFCRVLCTGNGTNQHY